MKNNARCDLAVEAKELLDKSSGKEDFDGIETETDEIDGYIYITRVRIKNKNGENRIGKKQGNYITVQMPKRFYGQQKIYEEMCRTCAAELEKLITPFLKNRDSSVLVIGLGNWNITADALGPKVIKSLMITRHLLEYIPEEIDERIRPVSAIAPGVLGLTGIETVEISRGLVDRVKPDLVIAIDALCSRSVERVNTTVQFSDTGITPGEGIGNKRKAINKDTLGVPVIAIGVPTVVDASTIAREAIEITAKRMYKADELNENVIDSVTDEMFKNFVVAPKEVDVIIDDISHVIANGINIALHEGLTMDDIDKYV